MGKADFIGGRGEAIAFTQLTQFRPEGEAPYFWPHFLGEKCQTFDFLVELVDAGEATPFFLVQVKATGKDFTKRPPPRLRVEVSEADVRRMAAFPAPTYVVGVHEDEGRAFVVCVSGQMRQAISSLSIARELTPDTLHTLYDEVRGFWQARDMVQTASAFPN